MQKKFDEFREKYPLFSYNGYALTKTENEIKIVYDFNIEGLCSFRPETRIQTDNLDIINDFDSPVAKKIIFSLGMVEAVSYWKCACPKKMRVNGYLDDEDILWWKKLYFNGLGEFFYRNNIRTSLEDFVEIDAVGCDYEKNTFFSSGKNLIPVGGGKDSNVTMELLSELRDKNMMFTVNNQGARTDSVLSAGYEEKNILKTFRTISPELLERNKEGFLNGHTPFSAIVAFLSLYCAYLIGAENIVLSNEASANEGNIEGFSVNHQYSKSYEFEADFNHYVEKHFTDKINYFSLLRPFNELQIAKQFSALKKFHPVFKSCNVGSKKNIWCAQCAKCLFVYIILSPFLTVEELVKIFGKNLLDEKDLEKDFDGLVGFSSVKPFECIGTVEEVCTAIEMTIKNSGENLPYLLKKYKEKREINPDTSLLEYFNDENSIPEKFMKYVERMHKYVAENI